MEENLWAVLSQWRQSKMFNVHRTLVRWTILMCSVHLRRSNSGRKCDRFRYAVAAASYKWIGVSMMLAGFHYLPDCEHHQSLCRVVECRVHHLLLSWKLCICVERFCWFVPRWCSLMTAITARVVGSLRGRKWDRWRSITCHVWFSRSLARSVQFVVQVSVAFSCC